MVYRCRGKFDWRFRGRVWEWLPLLVQSYTSRLCAAGQTALKEAARVTRQSLSKFCPQPREGSSLNPSIGDQRYTTHPSNSRCPAQNSKAGGAPEDSEAHRGMWGAPVQHSSITFMRLWSVGLKFRLNAALILFPSHWQCTHMLIFNQCYFPAHVTAPRGFMCLSKSLPLCHENLLTFQIAFWVSSVKRVARTQRQAEINTSNLIACTLWMKESLPSWWTGIN